jgi:hypothetical protein
MEKDIQSKKRALSKLELTIFISEKEDSKQQLLRRDKEDVTSY